MGSEDAERVRLLHVDDHADVVTPLSSRLEASGEFRVTVERDADAARATLDDEQFDCVLLAETVADTSAAEFCRQVRTAGRDCPILVLTERPAAAVDAGVLEAGATDVVDASSEAFLELLRQRIRLVVDRGGDPGGHPSLHRLVAGLPLGVFATDDALSFANPALEELAGDDVRVGTTSLAEALDVPERAVDPAQPDPTIVRSERAAGEAASSAVANGEGASAEGASGDGASGEGTSDGEAPAEPTDLALWTTPASDGPGSGTVGAVWDIDAGSGVLGEYKEHSDMLDSLLASLPVAVVFRDEDGRYVAASDHVTRLGPGRALTAPDGTVHHTPADVVGKTDHDLYPTALAEAAVDEHRDVLDSEQPATDRSGRSYSLQGEEVALATTTAPWYDAEGAVVGTVSVWTDVSERVRSAREATVQGEVVDVVASELHPELEAAVRDLDAAAGAERGAPSGGATDSEQPDGAPVDRSASDQPPDAGGAPASDPIAHLRRIVDDLGRIVAVARLDRTTVEPTELDVVTEAAWETVAERTDADCDLAVETEAVVQADPDGLRRFLAAVLLNAVESGASEIRVGTRELGFFVADDGPGIPPGERERVLEYGHSTHSEAVGAGLTVAELVASAHEWTLSIADSADGGTRIEVDDVRFL